MLVEHGQIGTELRFGVIGLAIGTALGLEVEDGIGAIGEPDHGISAASYVAFAVVQRQFRGHGLTGCPELVGKERLYPIGVITSRYRCPVLGLQEILQGEVD